MTDTVPVSSSFSMDAPSSTAATTVVVFTDVSALMPAAGHANGSPGIDIETMSPFSIVGHGRPATQPGLVVGGRRLDEHALPGTVLVVAQSAATTNTSCPLVGNAQNQPIDDHHHHHSHQTDASEMSLLSPEALAAEAVLVPVPMAAGPPSHDLSLGAVAQGDTVTGTAPVAPVPPTSSTADEVDLAVPPPPPQFSLADAADAADAAAATTANTNAPMGPSALPVASTAVSSDVVGGGSGAGTSTGVAVSAARATVLRPDNHTYNQNTSNPLPAHHHHHHHHHHMPPHTEGSHHGAGGVPAHVPMALVVSLEGTSTLMAPSATDGHPHTLGRALDASSGLATSAAAAAAASAENNAAAAAAVVATVVEHVAHDPALQRQLQEMSDMDVASFPDAVAEAAAAAVVEATGAGAGGPLAKSSVTTRPGRREAGAGIPRLTVTAVPAVTLAHAVAAAAAAAGTSVSSEDVLRAHGPLPPPPQSPQSSCECAVTTATAPGPARAAHEPVVVPHVALSTERVATMETAVLETAMEVFHNVPASTTVSLPERDRSTGPHEAHRSPRRPTTTTTTTTAATTAAASRASRAESERDKLRDEVWDSQESAVLAVFMPDAVQVLCRSTSVGDLLSAVPVPLDGAWSAHDGTDDASTSASSSQLLVQTLSCGIALGHHRCSVEAVPGGATPSKDAATPARADTPMWLGGDALGRRPVHPSAAATASPRLTSTATMSASSWMSHSAAHAYALPPGPAPYLAPGSPHTSTSITTTTSSRYARAGSLAGVFVPAAGVTIVVADTREGGEEAATMGVPGANMTSTDSLWPPIELLTSFASLPTSGQRGAAHSLSSASSGLVGGVTDLRQFLVHPSRRGDSGPVRFEQLAVHHTPPPLPQRLSESVPASRGPRTVLAEAVEDEDAPIPAAVRGQRQWSAPPSGRHVDPSHTPRPCRRPSGPASSVASLSSVRFFAASAASDSPHCQPWALPRAVEAVTEAQLDGPRLPLPAGTTRPLSPRHVTAGAALGGERSERRERRESGEKGMAMVARPYSNSPLPLWHRVRGATSPAAAVGAVGLEESDEVLPLPYFESSWSRTEPGSRSPSRHRRAPLTPPLGAHRVTPRRSNISDADSDVTATTTTTTSARTERTSGAGGVRRTTPLTPMTRSSARAVPTAPLAAAAAAGVVHTRLPGVGASLLNTVTLAIPFPRQRRPSDDPLDARAGSVDGTGAVAVSVLDDDGDDASHGANLWGGSSSNSDSAHHGGSSDNGLHDHNPRYELLVRPRDQGGAGHGPLTASVGLPPPPRTHARTTATSDSSGTSPTSLLSELWQNAGAQTPGNAHNGPRDTTQSFVGLLAVGDALTSVHELASQDGDDSMPSRTALPYCENRELPAVDTALPSPTTMGLMTCSASTRRHNHSARSSDENSRDSDGSQRAHTVSSTTNPSSGGSVSRSRAADTVTHPTDSALSDDGLDIDAQRSLAPSATGACPAAWSVSPPSATFLMCMDKDNTSGIFPAPQSSACAVPEEETHGSQSQDPQHSFLLSTRPAASWCESDGVASPRPSAALTRRRLSLWRGRRSHAQRAAQHTSTCSARAPPSMGTTPPVMPDTVAGFLTQVPWSPMTTPERRSGLSSPTTTTYQRPSPPWGYTPTSPQSSTPQSPAHAVDPSAQASFLLSAWGTTPLADFGTHDGTTPTPHADDSPPMPAAEARQHGVVPIEAGPWRIYTPDAFADRPGVASHSREPTHARQPSRRAQRGGAKRPVTEAWVTTTAASALMASMMARPRSASGTRMLSFSFLGAGRNALTHASSSSSLVSADSGRHRGTHTATTYAPSTRRAVVLPISPTPTQTQTPQSPGSYSPNSVPLIVFDSPTSASPPHPSVSAGRSLCYSTITTFVTGEDAT